MTSSRAPILGRCAVACASGLFGAAVLLLDRARAGAFLYPEGKGQAIVTTTFADSRNAYDAQGRLIKTPPYRKFEARAYLEHGLTDWLTLVLEGSAFDFRGGAAPNAYVDLLTAQAKAGLPLALTPPGGPQYQGVGLGALGARLRLLDYGGFVLSAEASLRTASPAARRFLDMRRPWQADARLMLGRAIEIWGVPGFLDAQLGYRSAGQAGDELRADLTIGLRPFERFMVMAQSFSAVTPHAPVGVFAMTQKFQLSGVYNLAPNYSLQIGGLVAPGGVNAPAERGAFFAIWRRY